MPAPTRLCCFLLSLWDHIYPGCAVFMRWVLPPKCSPSFSQKALLVGCSHPAGDTPTLQGWGQTHGLARRLVLSPTSPPSLPAWAEQAVAGVLIGQVPLPPSALSLPLSNTKLPWFWALGVLCSR